MEEAFTVDLEKVSRRFDKFPAAGAAGAGFGRRRVLLLTLLVHNIAAVEQIDGDCSRV